MGNNMLVSISCSLKFQKIIFVPEKYALIVNFLFVASVPAFLI